MQQTYLALSTALAVHRLLGLIHRLPDLKSIDANLWSVHRYHCAVALSDSHHRYYRSTMSGLEADK